MRRRRQGRRSKIFREYLNLLLERKRDMRKPSSQILSVQEAFEGQDWHAEMIEGQDVLRMVFAGYHTKMEVFAQTFSAIQALVVVGEVACPLREETVGLVLELLARANKRLTLGGFELDLDRRRLLFRITNVFERERFAADICCSMVHSAVVELDRLVPYVMTVVQTPDDLLDDLDLVRLLQREDLIPPVEGDEDEI